MIEHDPIDNLLRRNLSGPVPSLSPEFERRLMQKVQRPTPNRRIFFTAYGVISAATSAAVMRNQGLSWTAIAVSLILPVAIAITVPKLPNQVRHQS